MNNCPNNDNIYQDALNKIKHDQKFKPDCCSAVGMGGATGPTGPTGPAGPATITVGETQTGAPGTVAQVSNSGTAQNVILDFVIPQGPTGPTGETGATGPTGPANGLNAYAGLYNNTTQTISDATTAQQITLNSQMPNENLTYGPANSMTIVEAGDYEITYFVELSVGTAADVTIEVRNNQVSLPATEIVKNLQPSNLTTFSGNTIVTLAPSNVIDLAVLTSTTSVVTLDNTGVTASLTLKKID